MCIMVILFNCLKNLFCKPKEKYKYYNILVEIFNNKFLDILIETNGFKDLYKNDHSYLEVINNVISNNIKINTYDSEVRKKCEKISSYINNSDFKFYMKIYIISNIDKFIKNEIINDEEINSDDYYNCINNYNSNSRCNEKKELVNNDKLTNVNDKSVVDNDKLVVNNDKLNKKNKKRNRNKNKKTNSNSNDKSTNTDSNDKLINVNLLLKSINTDSNDKQINNNKIMNYYNDNNIENIKRKIIKIFIKESIKNLQITNKQQVRFYYYFFNKKIHEFLYTTEFVDINIYACLIDIFINILNNKFNNNNNINIIYKKSDLTNNYCILLQYNHYTLYYKKIEIYNSLNTNNIKYKQNDSYNCSIYIIKYIVNKINTNQKVIDYFNNINIHHYRFEFLKFIIKNY